MIDLSLLNETYRRSLLWDPTRALPISKINANIFATNEAETYDQTCIARQHIRSALLDEDDIANAMVVCDVSGRKMILLITKSCEAVFVRHTPNNIAYLETLGLKILSVPSAIKVGLKK